MILDKFLIWQIQIFLWVSTHKSPIRKIISSLNRQAIVISDTLSLLGFSCQFSVRINFLDGFPYIPNDFWHIRKFRFPVVVNQALFQHGLDTESKWLHQISTEVSSVLLFHMYLCYNAFLDINSENYQVHIIWKLSRLYHASYTLL